MRAYSGANSTTFRPLGAGTLFTWRYNLGGGALPTTAHLLSQASQFAFDAGHGSGRFRSSDELASCVPSSRSTTDSSPDERLTCIRQRCYRWRCSSRMRFNSSMGGPLLKSLLDVGIPALVFAAMLVVGMELTLEDFRRVARRPKVVVAATVGQCIALPAIAWALLSGLRLQPSIAQGVLLVAACPSGAMANLYTYLARSNVALSVSLTAVSCLAGLLTTPLALGILQTQVERTTHLSVPLGPLAGQLAVVMVLPVLTGMYVQHCRPEITKRHGRTLMRVSVAALALLLMAVIVQELPRFVGELPEIGTAAGLLTMMAFTAGWATGFISGANGTDRVAVGMVFVVRNVGIATAIAVTVLGRSDFAVFATAYFLAQVPLLLAAAVAFRRRAAAHVAMGVQGQ